MIQAGDRIAVYGTVSRQYATGGWGSSMDRTIGVVTQIYDDRTAPLTFKTEDGCEYAAHPKQCRKLKPRRRFWLPKIWTEEQVNLFLQNPEEYMIAKPQKGNLVEFIEYTEVSKK